MDCPYLNLITWNHTNGHPNAEIFRQQQKTLENCIRELNNKTRSLNRGVVNFHLAKDMGIPIKKKEI